MADPVEQCRLTSTAQPGAHDQFPRAFDLNHAMSHSETDNSKDTDTSSYDSQSSSVCDNESCCVSSNKTSCSSASAAASAASGRSPCFGNGLIPLTDGDKVHDLIKCRFMSGLGPLGEKTAVTAIHKNCYSGATAQAHAQAFQIYLQATEKKRSGNANVKYGWFAASKAGIAKILSYGFGHSGNTEGGWLYGSGIYLSPDNHPLERQESQVYARFY